MFVQHNDLSGVKDYFASKLQQLFTESEIKQIVKMFVCNRLNISNSEYLFASELKFSESDLLYFRDVVKRLGKDEPVQYVLGEAFFYDLELKIDERALIPRPETEELVDWIVKEFDSSKSWKMTDVCAGSGCIALALKSVFPASEVDALELSQEAISLIQENKGKTDLEINVVPFDAVEGSLSELNKTYDVIVSNPPYIPQKDRAMMHRNVLDFEPDMALFVEDDDALLFYRRIGEDSMSVLGENGSLFFEIHEDLGQSVVELLKEIGFVNIELRKDLQGKDRMVRARKVSSLYENTGRSTGN